MVVVIMLGKVIKMNREELDLLEIVFTLAIGECACNDIDNIQKLEDKIKTINNLCKKQKEVIDRIQKIINTEIKLMGYAVNDSCLMLIQDILNEVTNNE